MTGETKVSGPLIWSVVCIGVTAIAVLMLLPPVARAAFGPSLEGDEVGDRVAKLMTQHEEAIATYRERFDGRSVFFKPKQPRVERPPAPRDERRVEAPIEDEPPKLPQKPPYGGPAITGFVGERVWFTGGLIVGVGEERDDVRVVSVVDLPRSAQIFYRGFEHKVEFLEAVPDDFFGVADAGRNAELPGISTATDDSNAEGASPGESSEPAKETEDADDEEASADEDPKAAPGAGVGGRRTGRNAPVPRNDPRKNALKGEGD